jgi:hypothetical protein
MTLARVVVFLGVVCLNRIQASLPSAGRSPSLLDRLAPRTTHTSQPAAAAGLSGAPAWAQGRPVAYPIRVGIEAPWGPTLLAAAGASQPPRLNHRPRRHAPVALAAAPPGPSRRLGAAAASRAPAPPSAHQSRGGGSRAERCCERVGAHRHARTQRARGRRLSRAGGLGGGRGRQHPGRPAHHRRRRRSQ